VELSNWRYFIFGAALVILMLVRPEGLLPSRRAKAELHPEEGTIEADVQDEEPALEPTDEATRDRQTLYDVRELGESPEEER
jgi:branched-chain amino acid transport system permease protein